jgi:hypothetical protein
MDFSSALTFFGNNYTSIVVIIALLFTFINIANIYFTNKYETNTQKQLNTFNRTIDNLQYGNMIVFVLLFIFVFDFIYNKRYKVDVATVTPKLDILKNILIPI